MYCSESDSTWAKVEDLYGRFGDEYIDKIAIRRVYDVDLDSYVADESDAGKEQVINLALCDAKELITRKLSCYYSGIPIINELIFPGILQWHIKLTIETLKAGGDCSGCACVTDMESYFKCGPICTDDGVCLTSRKTFISISQAVFNCDMCGATECKCCR